MVAGMRRIVVRPHHRPMTTNYLPTHSSRVGELMRRMGKASNTLTRHLAGRRFVTIWALISYRGRRSGKIYTLPVAIAATPDSFVIPMPFPDAQWIRNVLAAGECQIRWNGRDWRAIKPEVISKAEGAASFGLIPRLALRLLPIDRFLRLHRSEAGHDDAVPGRWARRLSLGRV
jgi:deazaflavin-dependent oxidoreductase (nitroreductase family)